MLWNWIKLADILWIIFNFNALLSSSKLFLDTKVGKGVQLVPENRPFASRKKNMRNDETVSNTRPTLGTKKMLHFK